MSRASSVADAVRQMRCSVPGAKFIAGGTNLVDLMKDGRRAAGEADRHHPAAARRQVEETAGGGLRIGALVRNADLAYHPLVEQRYPVLSRRSWPARRRSCATWRRPAAISCSARAATISTTSRRPATSASRGSGCSAIDGFNRMHAILGASEHCIATHPSDMCVALAALEAVVQVAGPPASASIPFADFHRLPGDTPQRDTNLEPGRAHHRHRPAAREGFADHYTYLKIRDRLSYAFALVSVAAALELDGEQHRRGADRAGRRRAQAVARAARPKPRCAADRRSATSSTAAADLAAPRAPRASGTTPSRSSWRAAPSCAR